MRHGASGPAWEEEISETLSRKLAPVYELKGLSSPYDGSPSHDNGLPHAATACRNLRRAAASCDGPSYVDDGPSQVAADRRTWIVPGREPWTKVDRLLFGAMIEARSCERFTRLLEVIEDQEVAHLLADLGPAERRHWQLFYQLAGRETDAETLAARFQQWREFEADLSRSLGTSPAVHG
jgi:hypothetical protein